MSSQVDRITEVIASSPLSFDDAIRSGLASATAALDNVSGAAVGGHRLEIRDGVVTTYQVTLKLSFDADQAAA